MDFNGYVPYLALKMDYGFTNLYVKNKKKIGDVCKRVGFIVSTSGANFVKKHLKFTNITYLIKNTKIKYKSKLKSRKMVQPDLF